MARRSPFRDLERAAGSLDLPREEIMALAVLRHSRRDAMLVALAVLYGALLLVAPSPLLVALGIWWTANTVAHNFIHLPFFRASWANRAFSAYLSLLLGVPQTLWRDRHLAHHADKPWRLRWSRQLTAETVLVATLWIIIAGQGTQLFFGVWLAGWLGGMTLCWLQGYYEHVRGTVSHYGALYNLAFFNDGFHVEHHARPGMHWTELPRHAQPAAERSRWPAVLRWLDIVPLDALERMVLRSRWMQRFVVDRHARAFRRAVAELPPIRRVTIVGGGIFPRTALVVRALLPEAEITIVDQSAENLRSARPYLEGGVRVVTARYSPEHCAGTDLLVVPLAYAGDRADFYDHPPAPAVAVHDWIWHRRGAGFVVSLLLLKRLNVVMGAPRSSSAH